MNTAHRVVARYIEAFAKFHPVYNVVNKAGRVLEKAYAASRRFAEFAGKADRYKGDPAKITPNAEKSWQAVDEMLGVADSIDKPIADFINDYAKDLKSDYRKSVLGDLVKWHDGMKKAVEDTRHGSYYQERVTDRSYGVSLFDTQRDKLYRAIRNVIADVEMAAKIQMKGPGALAPDTSPEDRFKAFITSEITSMAKACVKKLGGKPAPCAALGLNVLEDVNAHKAAAKIQGMLDHYVKEVTDAEGDIIQTLVRKVSSAIDWNFEPAGAFLVVLLQLTHAPEAGRVQDTLAKAFVEH